MAVRACKLIPNAAYIGGESSLIYEWTGLLNGDTGAFIQIPTHADITVEILGTSPVTSVASVLGVGGIITWEGTMDDTSPPIAGNQGGLHKPDGTALTQNALAAINQVLEHVVQIRPNVTGGDGTTTLTARVHVTRAWRK